MNEYAVFFIDAISGKEEYVVYSGNSYEDVRNQFNEEIGPAGVIDYIIEG